jgi:23S rRNA pseudouridine2605 synthase
MEERLQKILARAGLGSRRSCESIITNRRVSVNGQVARLGSKADPARDKILVDGKPISTPESSIYIALYKPRGVLSSVEAPDSRRTVRDLVPIIENVYPVGRLDLDSEGLILLTNDGELTDRLTHPRYGHEKEYRVLVSRHPDTAQLEAWQRGIVLTDGHKSAPAQISIESAAGKGTWLRIIMTEGRKRQIRETGALIGLPVVRIIRTRIGTLRLGRLKPSEWRHLTPAEIQQLRDFAHQEPASRKPQRTRWDATAVTRKPGLKTSYGNRQEKKLPRPARSENTSPHRSRNKKP